MLRRFPFLGGAVLSCAAIMAVAESAQARTYVAIGVGVGVGRPYYGYPGYYGYPRYYGYYPYPSYYAVPVYQPVYVVPPVRAAATPSATASPNTAQVEIHLPDANAEVWLEGRKMPSNGSATRVYASPPLEPGKSYTYHVTAAWFQNGKVVKEERSVPVTAGATQVVDFRGGGSGIEGIPAPTPTTPK